MHAAWAVGTAVSFTWLGMVLAISFLEAPLKFGAPGVTVRIGLGIGRRVFRALNAVEIVFAAVLLSVFAVGPPPVPPATVMLLVATVLLVQLVLVRPYLNRRTKAVLAGAAGSRSCGHYAYIALEIGKVAVLGAAGGMFAVGG